MSDWLAASAALNLCSHIPNAHIVLCTRAHQGLLRTRAHLFDQAGTRNTDVELPIEFWWADGYAALNQNWQAGDFSTWIDHTYHWQAFSVEFFQGDVERLAMPTQHIPGHVDRGDKPVRSHDAGTPRKRGAQWDDWIAHLALCVAESEIFGNTGPEAAMAKIAKRMAEAGIDEMARSTVQNAVNRTLEVLEKGGIMPTKR